MIRIDVASLDLLRSATWFADGSVIIHDGRRITTTARNRAEFDALCEEHDIEPVKGGTMRRQGIVIKKVVHEAIF